MAASIVGFVGRDGNGLAGLELSYEKYLKGREGKFLVESDPHGRQIISNNEKIIEKPQDGMNVTLTIDETLQYKAEQVIAATTKKFSANFGMVLLMNPQNGELLALATSPQPDPNNYSKYSMSDWQSKPVSWVYEPGSTFKCITVAAGVDAGKCSRDSKLTFMRQIVVGGKVIENSHTITKWPEGAAYTVSEMLQQSLNTGVVQIGLKLGKDVFYNYIKKFGFGTAIKLGLPGESRGILRAPENWYASDIGMMTFGQGIAATPIQVLAALNAIANKGELIAPVLIKKVSSADENIVISKSKISLGRPISEKAARETTLIMEDVTYKGTGHRGKIEGFTVASKTGTAQKIKEGSIGYLKGHYVASYFAFAPTDNPKISMLVIIDDPKGSIWGESTAGPVFGELGSFALRYLNAKPNSL
jgi:stage V sporulation protein D (sporulation-specific penicillin-binding protein)